MTEISAVDTQSAFSLSSHLQLVYSRLQREQFWLAQAVWGYLHDILGRVTSAKYYNKNGIDFTSQFLERKLP